ncbi:MAG: glycosyltransferase family 2 protein [bacterium]|nr:glycosyltransferase family 2 protein [bacterium]
MSGITLSICITTRNRVAFLVQTLANLLGQAAEEVEIAVLDAASGDGTRQAAEALASVNPSLSYYRRETNQGIDRDYANVADMARGEYVWFMSDDDLLAAGAVNRVLEACRKGHALIVVNAEDWNADFSERLGGPRLGIREDREFGRDQFVELFETVGHFLSFIPGVVVRKEIWSSREKEPYFGSFFAHLGVLFQAPLPGSALVIAESLVRIRNGNVSWSGRSFEVWMVRWPFLISSLEALPQASRQKVSHPEPWRIPAKLVEYRAMGAYSLEEYRKWIAPRHPSALVRALAFAIAITPGILVNSLCLGYFLLFAKGRKIPPFHLRTSRFYIGKLLPRSRRAESGSKS